MVLRQLLMAICLLPFFNLAAHNIHPTYYLPLTQNNSNVANSFMLFGQSEFTANGLILKSENQTKSNAFLLSPSLDTLPAYFELVTRLSFENGGEAGQTFAVNFGANLPKPFTRPKYPLSIHLAPPGVFNVHYYNNGQLQSLPTFPDSPTNFRLGQLLEFDLSIKVIAMPDSTYTLTLSLISRARNLPLFLRAVTLTKAQSRNILGHIAYSYTDSVKTSAVTISAMGIYGSGFALNSLTATPSIYSKLINRDSVFIRHYFPDGTDSILSMPISKFKITNPKVKIPNQIKIIDFNQFDSLTQQEPKSTTQYIITGHLTADDKALINWNYFLWYYHKFLINHWVVFIPNAHAYQQHYWPDTAMGGSVSGLVADYPTLLLAITQIATPFTCLGGNNMETFAWPPDCVVPLRPDYHSHLQVPQPINVNYTLPTLTVGKQNYLFVADYRLALLWLWLQNKHLNIDFNLSSKSCRKHFYQSTHNFAQQLQTEPNLKYILIK